MNLGQIIISVQRQFGDESGAQITRSDIVRWSNDAQVDIVRKTECLQVHSETDVIKDDGSYDVPFDFIKLRRVTFDGKRLARVELEELDNLNSDQSNSNSSYPEMFYVWGRKIWLYPKPSKSGTGNLDVYYVKMPNELVSDQDVPEIPTHLHEDIIRFCLIRAKELNEDDEKAQALMFEYDGRMAMSRDEVTNPEIESYPAVRDLDSMWGGW